MLRALCLLFPLFMYSALSQEVSGVVGSVDQPDGLRGATVRLISLTDSAKVLGAISTTNGKFTVKNVSSGRYKTRISFVGYKPVDTLISVGDDNVDLGMFVLNQDSLLTKDVQVEAVATRVMIDGDTTSYNANAFKTTPNASSEDLVAKMPGVTIENGQVKAQGEVVQKVLVDGKEFFGDDASATLRNLPADMVDRVQVYDRGSDQSMYSGFDDGNTQKTINLITKADKRNGIFGRISGGYGTIDRYNANGMLNYFNGNQRITVLAQTNNINQQNFAMQDLFGLSGGAGGGPRGGGGGGRMMGGGGPRGGGFGGNSNAGDPSNFFVNSQNGITSTNAVGVNYSDVYGGNTLVAASYFLNDNSNEKISLLNRDYTLDGQPLPTYSENGTTTTNNTTHRINVRVESYLDSLNSIVIAPRGTFSQAGNTNSILGNTGVAGFGTVNTTTTRTTSDNSGYNFSGTLTYKHRFEDPRRNITVSFDANATNRDVDGTLTSLNEYFNTADSTEAFDQFSTQLTTGQTYGGTIAYTEPLSERVMAQLSYSPSFNQNESNKETRTVDSIISGGIVEPQLSSAFTNDYTTHKALGLVRFRGDSSIVTVGATAQQAYLTGAQTFPTAFDVDRTFFNILPQLMWQVRFSANSNMRLFYRTSTQAPSISQLQSVIDNTNPLQVKAGNPQLDQDYTHSVFARFSTTNTTTAQSLFGFISASVTQNYIGTNTTFATQDTVIENIQVARGGQLSRPVNLNGYTSLRTFFNTGLPVPDLGGNLNFNAGATYTRTPGLINDQENIANSTALNGGFYFSTGASELFDASVSYNGAYTIVSNSLQQSLNQNYFTHTATGKLIWILGALACSTDVSHTMYTGLGEGYDRNYTVWNAGIGYRFLENKAAEIRLSIYDILAQNDAISRTVNDVYIEDTRTNALRRYAMLTFSYDLRAFGQQQQKPPFPMGHGGPPR